jgi:hypothetical protein
VLIITIALPQSNCFAQLKVYEDIGGGGSSNAQEQSNDNSFIYIVGGALIAGILVYALVLKKDSKTETDTTAVIESLLNMNSSVVSHSIQNEIVKAKDKLPVDFFFGIKNNEAVLKDKTYLVGVSVRL